MSESEQENAIITHRQFIEIIKPIASPIKSFHCGFNYIEQWLQNEQEASEHGVELNPDFQRGHVWTEKQQIRYIENILRKIVDDSGLTIRFNCPSWRTDRDPKSNLIEQTVCLDGLQRLTAVRRFINGELKVFGFEFNELPRRTILRDLQLVFKMYDFQFRKDLLQYYLDINEGSTPHSKMNLEYVREELRKELAA